MVFLINFLDNCWGLKGLQVICFLEARLGTLPLNSYLNYSIPLIFRIILFYLFSKKAAACGRTAAVGDAAGAADQTVAAQGGCFGLRG